MEKYQTCIRYQAEKSRRRITALVAATYDEEKKSTKGHNKRFDFDVEEPCHALREGSWPGNRKVVN